MMPAFFLPLTYFKYFVSQLYKVMLILGLFFWKDERVMQGGGGVNLTLPSESPAVLGLSIKDFIEFASPNIRMFLYLPLPISNSVLTA